MWIRRKFFKDNHIVYRHPQRHSIEIGIKSIPFYVPQKPFSKKNCRSHSFLVLSKSCVNCFSKSIFKKMSNKTKRKRNRRNSMNYRACNKQTSKQKKNTVPNRNSTMGESSRNRLKDNSVDKTILMLPNAEKKCSHKKATWTQLYHRQMLKWRLVLR